MNLPPGPSSRQLIHDNRGAHFHHIAWTPPPAHSWKLNFAGFIADEERAIGGAAFIIRDENAIFKIGCALPLKRTRTLVAAEIVALTTALDVATGQGIDYLEIEGDCSTVFHLLNGQLSAPSQLTEGLVEDCLDFIRKFRSVAFHPVEVISNQAANRLAVLAVQENGPLRWTDGPPTAIAEILIDDVIGRWVPAPNA